MKVEPIVLEGARVRLEPLGSEHAAGLDAVVRDGELWTLPVTMVPYVHEIPSFIALAEEALQEGRELAFATIDRATDRVVGSTRFMCIDTVHKRAEIGYTFLAVSAQRTHVNTEAKYLMLRHAFETWNVNRIELITDVLNTTSRNAILRIGATPEGVLRSHLIMRDGRVRDSSVFSIIASEWSSVKTALEARMMRDV